MYLSNCKQKKYLNPSLIIRGILCNIIYLLRYTEYSKINGVIKLGQKVNVSGNQDVIFYFVDYEIFKKQSGVN